MLNRSYQTSASWGAQNTTASAVSFLASFLARNRLTLVFVALNLADCLLTSVLLSHGMVEANPLWRYESLWLKMPLVVLLAVYFRKRSTTMMILALGMALVVLWNLHLLGLSLCGTPGLIG